MAAGRGAVNTGHGTSRSWREEQAGAARWAERGPHSAACRTELGERTHAHEMPGGRPSLTTLFLSPNHSVGSERCSGRSRLYSHDIFEAPCLHEDPVRLPFTFLIRTYSLLPKSPLHLIRPESIRSLSEVLKSCSLREDGLDRYLFSLSQTLFLQLFRCPKLVRLLYKLELGLYTICGIS